MESQNGVSGETDLTSEREAEEGSVRLTVCNVCHLEYDGDECPWCRAEREQAAAAIEERGRRSRRLKEDADDSSTMH
jgi:hypothetical protein